MNALLAIAGQSHLRSYLPAASLAAAEVREIEVDGARVLDGPLPRDTEYWSRFAAVAGGQTAAIVWGGNQHDIFLVERTTPLDFVLSTAPDLPLDPRASYVAEAHLRAVFAPSFAGLPDVISQLNAAGATVLVAGTTPPINDPEALARRVAGDEPLPGAGAPTFSSPYTMQKLWSLVQTMTAEIAAQTSATFVSVPDRLRSADGFLLPALWGDDLAPGPAFGREMIAELRSVAETLESHR